MAEPTQRLFLALWPDDAVRERMAAIAPQLGLTDGRLIAPENLHVTLVFLGSIEVSRRAGIELAVSKTSAEPFDLSLTDVVWHRRNRMLWLAAPEPPAPLNRLVTSLRQSLDAFGVSVEHRPYRLHVTLARDVARGPVRHPIAPIVWAVHDMCLVSSRVTTAGSRYTVERRWPLTAAGEND